jgi:hypothetical protein
MGREPTARGCGGLFRGDRNVLKDLHDGCTTKFTKKKITKLYP